MKTTYLYIVLALALASGATACADKDSRCEKWARKGQCDSEAKPWVLRKCPKSCDNCQSPKWTHSGELTAYDGTFTTGNCGFEETFGKGVTHYVAINTPQWNGGMHCGRCVEVICTHAGCPKPANRIVAQISDRCPGCAKGDLDLSFTAWSDVTGGMYPDRFDGRWKFVTCPDAYAMGNFRLLLKTGSNPWWFALQPLNFKVPVKSVIIYDADGTEYVLIAPGEPGNTVNSYYWQGSAPSGLKGPLRIVVIARNGKELVGNSDELWAPGTSIEFSGSL